MGWESALFLGFNILQARAQGQAAKAEANAKVQEGTIAAKNKAKETLVNTARLQSSFLNSGLTLDGTPRSVIDAEFNQGLEDTNQIISNTNSVSKNIINKGRTQALSTIASTAAMSSFSLPSMNTIGQESSRLFASGTTSYGPQIPLWGQ